MKGNTRGRECGQLVKEENSESAGETSGYAYLGNPVTSERARNISRGLSPV